MNPLIIAHRGASKYAPENTMPAFELAYEMKADGIETDVQLTKDGIPILIHDEDLRRTTNGYGLVGDYNLVELRTLDAGKFFSNAYTGTKLITLDEFLDWAKDKSLCLNLELKNNKIAYKNIEEKVLDTVSKFSVKERTTLSSFNVASVKRLRELDKEIDVALLRSRRHDNLVPYAQELGASSLHVNKRLLNKELLQLCNKQNMPVRVFTVNRSMQLWKYTRKRIAGIITDVPDRAIRLRPIK